MLFYYKKKKINLLMHGMYVSYGKTNSLKKLKENWKKYSHLTQQLKSCYKVDIKYSQRLKKNFQNPIKKWGKALLRKK